MAIVIALVGKDRNGQQRRDDQQLHSSNSLWSNIRSNRRLVCRIVKTRG
jgi:hypothetical protein